MHKLPSSFVIFLSFFGSIQTSETLLSTEFKFSILSSPGQSPGRSIVLSPALVLASAALALANVKVLP